MAAFDKDKLFTRRLDEDDVEIPGVGTARVRALSHHEVLAMRKAADMDMAKFDGPRALLIERKMIALAMIDPVLTEDEVAAWQENSPAGELADVSDRISELSGLFEGADKSGVPGARV